LLLGNGSSGCKEYKMRCLQWNLFHNNQSLSSS